ncbi:MAG: hypothetical protein OEX98_00020 [Nitrosopumilus sp.]|nr:hypothetical protein [Nitrosopumilus sp.]
MKRTTSSSSSNKKRRIKDLDKITPKQISKYEDSLEVLQLMRKQKMTLTKASKTVGISSKTVKRHLGSVIQKKSNRIIAKQNDNLPRKIRMYQNGKEIWVQVRGNKRAAEIAKYHGAVGRRLNQGQADAMKNFENKSIKDSKGKIHKFETNLKKLQDIAQRREESEFFSIYGGK